jgi:hypothetical protein
MADRNRVIYQSEALFVNPLATGFNSTGLAAPAGYAINAKGTNPSVAGAPPGTNFTNAGSTQTGLAASTIIQQLKRVQSANYSFTVNRQDVNQFGQLSRIDSLVVDTPTVSLDFSYLVTDGENETLLNFVTDGTTNSISGHIDPLISNAGQNFHILTVPEGQDAVKGDKVKPKENTVISLGNGFLSDYSMDASVGSFPTASVTIEGFNIKSDLNLTGDGTVARPYGKNTTGVLIPAIDPNDGSKLCDKSFALPLASTGSGISALKPGDITVDLRNAAIMSKQTLGNPNNVLAGAAHIQSASISLPMARTVLQRLGNTFGFAREIDFPLTATLTINALVADLKVGNMLDLLCGNDEKDLTVSMRNPECIDCDRGSAPTGIMYTLKGAILESESYSSSIGDNKTVDLTFSTQVGGPTDTGHGVFISGSNKYLTPPKWVSGGAALYSPGDLRG